MPTRTNDSSSAILSQTRQLPSLPPGIAADSGAFEHAGHDHVRDPGADTSFADAGFARVPLRKLASTPAEGGVSAAFASVSRGITANRCGAAMLTARFRPEQLVFEPLGLIEREMARVPAVVNRLAYEGRSKMTRVRIADGACSRRDGHAFARVNPVATVRSE